MLEFQLYITCENRRKNNITHTIVSHLIETIIVCFRMAFDIGRNNPMRAVVFNPIVVFCVF